VAAAAAADRIRPETSRGNAADGVTRAFVMLLTTMRARDVAGFGALAGVILVVVVVMYNVSVGRYCFNPPPPKRRNVTGVNVRRARARGTIFENAGRR